MPLPRPLAASSSPRPSFLGRHVPRLRLCPHVAVRPASMSSPRLMRTPVPGFGARSKSCFQMDAIHGMGSGHGRVFWGIYKMQTGAWPSLWRIEFQLRFLPIKCGLKDLSSQTRFPACVWLQWNPETHRPSPGRAEGAGDVVPRSGLVRKGWKPDPQAVGS